MQAEGPDDPNNQRITSDDFVYVTYDDDQAPPTFPYLGAPVGPRYLHIGQSNSDIFKHLIDEEVVELIQRCTNARANIEIQEDARKKNIDPTKITYNGVRYSN